MTLSTEGVFTYYVDNVLPAYQIVGKLLEEFPNEIAQDFISFLNLMALSASAKKLSNDELGIKLAEAMRILKSIQLDCAKIIIVDSSRRFILKTDALKQAGFIIPSSFYEEMRLLSKRREDLIGLGLVDISYNSNGTAADDLMLLANDYDSFVFRCEKEFGGSAAEAMQKNQMQSIWSNRKAILWGFVLGIVGSLIASWIWGKYFS